MTDEHTDPDVSDLESTDDDAGDDPGLVVTAVAGIAAVGVSMAARPILKGIYRKMTGSNPPLAEDPHVPFAKALAWTVFTATTGAVLELIVHRVTRRMLDG
jgi:hypothetical protein